MEYGDLTWEKTLAESHKKWLIYGSRSNKKLIPPHQWIKETLKKDLGEEYEYYAKGPTNSKYDKEYNDLKGLFYNKKEDITILKNDKIVGVVSFKFIASNYKQNANNYFETLLGECFNIQAIKIPFCYVFVTRYEIPYFKDGGKFQTTEKFSKYNIDRYIKLKHFRDIESIPKKISLSIINIKGDTLNDNILHFKDFKELDKKYQQKVLDNINVELCDYSLYGEKIANELNEMDIHKVLKEFADIIRENKL